MSAPGTNGGVQGTIYLLHFERPYRHARHYLGWTLDLDTRVREHANGRGARLMEVLREQGISFTIARTWTGDRHYERTLKNRKCAPRMCPLCPDK